MRYDDSRGIWSFNIQYERLWHDTEIRLVCLQHGTENEAVKCHLKHIELGWKHEPYEALSYEWGQPSPKDPLIILSGLPFRIGKNLYNALLHIRKPNEDRYVWIDALCINQENGEERNHQVAMMGTIYSGAEQVIVWLGLAGSGSEVSIDLIDYIHQLYETARRDQHRFPPQGYSHAQYLASSYIYGAEKRISAAEGGGLTITYESYSNELAWPKELKMGYEFVPDGRWQALLALLTRSYWRRMWIVQEIQLAQQLIFHCGPRSFTWDALKDICEFIVSTSEQELLSHISYIARDAFKDLKTTFAINLFGRRHAESRRPALRLKAWLYDCIRLGCTCSEPRDTVYALLGISQDCQEGEVVPDYGKPLLEVYYDAMALCTKDPPMPEINDYWLATKLAHTLDLNLELDEMAWPLISSAETLVESCH